MHISNSCVIQSSIIDDYATIGARSMILDGSILERGCVVEANSVVPPGK